jgi:hypothetical protein
MVQLELHQGFWVRSAPPQYVAVDRLEHNIWHVQSLYAFRSVLKSLVMYMAAGVRYKIKAVTLWLATMILASCQFIESKTNKYNARKFVVRRHHMAIS